MTARTIFAGVAACLLFLVACGGGGDNNAPPATGTALSGPTISQTCDLDDSQPRPAHLACEDLLARAGEVPELVSVTPMDWPDSCLGLAEGNETCAQVITPGFEVVFAIGATRYTYRTDEADNVRLADFTVGGEDGDGGAELIALASGPVAFDFAPDGRLFFNLLGLGEIRWIQPAEADPDRGTLFASLDVFKGSECGLLGIAIDPEFETNHFVYVYATQPGGPGGVAKPRVIRYTDVDGEGTDPTVIVDDLPTTNPRTCAHVGGNLHFGPDGYLYLSIGNNERSDEAVAHDLSKPLGKILRMTRDGTAAPGNPFENDPNADPLVYAYGLRNTFDFAFHPQTGKIYAPDNGPGNCDELNIIEPGNDYGVPGSLPPMEVDSCYGLGGTDPIYTFAQEGRTAEEFGSNVAPAGVAFLDGANYPALGEGLLVCFYNTGRLYHLTLGGADFDSVDSVHDIAPCSPNVEVWSGIIYFATAEGIYRLSPDAFQ